MRDDGLTPSPLGEGWEGGKTLVCEVRDLEDVRNFIKLSTLVFETGQE
jgi:hypothetical protein